MQKKPQHFTKEELDLLNVLKKNAETIEEVNTSFDGTTASLESSISFAEKQILEKGLSLPPKEVNATYKYEFSSSNTRLKSWEELVMDSQDSYIDDGDAIIRDLLTKDEIQAIEQKVAMLRGDFNNITKLDMYDWSICVVAGIMAACMDIFLVGLPRGQFSEGGTLSNWVRDKVNNTIPSEEIRKLERNNWVPYDASTSKNLDVKIAGLNPGTHRYKTLGHDPVLGFCFGVKDILCGEITAFDKFGKLVTQSVAIKDPSISGMNVFNAISRQIGHLKSDVTSERGLPIPFMGLLSYLGTSEKNSIGRLGEAMYRSGYDFRHFIAMSVPVMIIEVIVRTSFFIKSHFIEKKTFDDSLPIVNKNINKNKLQTMLFTAHFIATASNAGKFIISRNPLAINVSQWAIFARYAYKQLNYVLYDKENQRHEYVANLLSEEFCDINAALDVMWRSEKIDVIKLN